GISDNAWAMHLLALQRTLPGTSYASLTDALPTRAGVGPGIRLRHRTRGRGTPQSRAGGVSGACRAGTVSRARLGGSGVPLGG
ncbi:hypothetical protein ACWDSB_35495, partial [Streptomyces sp. NPDC003514]